MMNVVIMIMPLGVNCRQDGFWCWWKDQSILRHLLLNPTTHLLSTSSVGMARKVNAQNHKEKSYSGQNPWYSVWKQLGKWELGGINTCHLDSTDNIEKYSSFTLKVKPDTTFDEECQSLVQGCACILPGPEFQMLVLLLLNQQLKKALVNFQLVECKQRRTMFFKCYF